MIIKFSWFFKYKNEFEVEKFVFCLKTTLDDFIEDTNEILYDDFWSVIYTLVCTLHAKTWNQNITGTLCKNNINFEETF